MKRAAYVLAMLAILPLAGCGSSVKAGTVTEKQIIPAHDDTIIMPLYTGQTCVKIGTTQSCTPRYIYLPYRVHYNTAYALKLEACKDDLQHNTRKCKHGTAFVDEATYASVKIGDYYEHVKGDGKQSYRKIGREQKGGN